MASNDSRENAASRPNMPALTTWDRGSGPVLDQLNMTHLLLLDWLHKVLASFAIRRDPLPRGMLDGYYTNMRILTRIVMSEVHFMNALDMNYAFPHPDRRTILEHIIQRTQQLIVTYVVAGSTAKTSKSLLKDLAKAYNDPAKSIQAGDILAAQQALRAESKAYFELLSTTLNQISTSNFIITPSFQGGTERTMLVLVIGMETRARWEDAHYIDRLCESGVLQDPLERLRSGRVRPYALRSKIAVREIAKMLTSLRQLAQANTNMDVFSRIDEFRGFGLREQAALPLGWEIMQEEQAKRRRFPSSYR